MNEGKVTPGFGSKLTRETNLMPPVQGLSARFGRSGGIQDVTSEVDIGIPNQ